MSHWQYTNIAVIAAAVLAGGAALFFGLYFLYKYYINQRLKGRFKSLRLPRVSALIAAVALTALIGLGGVFGGSAARAHNDRLYARIGYLRAESAQYLPNAEVLAKSGAGADFNALDNPYDSGYTVLRFQEEMMFVFGKVTVFGRWVKLKDGKSAPLADYNLSGEYRLSYNEKTRKLSVVRICKTDGGDIIYRADYYYDASGAEVVECAVLFVSHEGGKDTVTRYQHLKNVRDKSFARFTVSEFKGGLPVTAAKEYTEGGDSLALYADYAKLLKAAKKYILI